VPGFRFKEQVSNLLRLRGKLLESEEVLKGTIHDIAAKEAWDRIDVLGYEPQSSKVFWDVGTVIEVIHLF